MSDSGDSFDQPAELDRRREALIRATRAAFQGLERAPAVRLELSAQCAWILLVELQRAWHHTRGHSREVVARIAHDLQDRYCPPGTVLGALAAAGWEDERILPVISVRWRIPKPFRRGLERQEGGDDSPGAGGARE